MSERGRSSVLSGVVSSFWFGIRLGVGRRDCGVGVRAGRRPPRRGRGLDSGAGCARLWGPEGKKGIEGVAVTRVRTDAGEQPECSGAGHPFVPRVGAWCAATVTGRGQSSGRPAARVSGVRQTNDHAPGHVRAVHAAPFSAWCRARICPSRMACDVGCPRTARRGSFASGFRREWCPRCGGYKLVLDCDFSPLVAFVQKSHDHSRSGVYRRGCRRGRR